MILLLNSLLSNAVDASTDEEILQEYLKTYREVYFDILYKRYSSKVYARCISMLKDDAAANDAVQDIFIKVLMNVSKFGGKSKFSSWLYSIAYNYCIDIIRKQKKKSTVPLDDLVFGIEQDDSEIEDKVLLETKIEMLKDVMEVMPAKDKGILLMKYQDGMSIKEISQLTSKSESAVKMQIKRAKQKFIYLKSELEIAG